MKVRYKSNKQETFASNFNVHALNEVLTGDDSCYVSDLDVFVNGKWKDMQQAFRDRDIIPDNYNTWFAEPKNEDDRKQGYFD